MTWSWGHPGFPGKAVLREQTLPPMASAASWSVRAVPVWNICLSPQQKVLMARDKIQMHA